MKKLKRALIILGCLVVLSILCIFFIKRYTPNNKKVNIEDILPGKTIANDETYIFMDDKYLDESRGMILDGKPYIPLDVASQYDSRFYYQEDAKELLFTDAKSVIHIKENTKTTLPDNKKYDIPPFITKNGKNYISIDFMNEHSSSNLGYYENPNRIIIFSNGTKLHSIQQKAAIRNLTGIKSYVLKEITDEPVKIIQKDIVEGWSKVVSSDGYIGYTETNKIGEDYKEIKTVNDEYSYFTMKNKINMGWHQVASQEGNITGTNLVALNHINVISPTWFSVIDDNGNISDFSSTEYVEQMHSKNISVWILVDDFNKDKDLTKVLKNEKARENLIKNLVDSTKKVGGDGINIDFEGISKENSLDFIQFLRELYIATRKEKLIVSTDNYVPMNYNKHYLRDQQNQVIDYFIIMGYDENTGGSKEAGSVSSYNFVKQGIENTLKDIPKNKIINGIPFYTRLWKEEPKSSVDASGLSSEILSMNAQEKVLHELGASPKWDEDTKQNYVQAVKDGITYKMWMEDEKSISEKLNLIKEYDLAGYSAWKLGLEDEKVWEVLKYE